MIELKVMEIVEEIENVIKNVNLLIHHPLLVFGNECPRYDIWDIR
jgi:hypothetical protein